MLLFSLFKGEVLGENYTKGKDSDLLDNSDKWCNGANSNRVTGSFTNTQTDDV